jgi:nicotinamide-nucleotide amidase
MNIPAEHQIYLRAQRLGELLELAGERVTAAESCTGGWISQAITAIPGSSGWFDVGFVTYSNAAKQHQLQVPGSYFTGPGAPGAVSEETVLAMARGALMASGADIAVATSGTAGPDGGTQGKPVGTVWIGWARRQNHGVSLDARVFHFPGDREAVRRQSVLAALDGLIGRLEPDIA